MSLDTVIRKLTKQAVEWEQQSAALEVDEPDEMSSIDTRSETYGEAAHFLRTVLRAERHGQLGIEQLWEPIPAEENAAVLLTPGEKYGTTAVPGDKWGMVLGDPDKVALVLLGSREQILKQLNDGAQEIEHSYRAEHENALHMGRQPQCPGCAEEPSLPDLRTVTVEIANSYECGRVTTSTEQVASPYYSDSLDDWWEQEVNDLTGDDHPCAASEHALYDAKITEVRFPELDGDLVGQTYSWEG